MRIVIGYSEDLGRSRADLVETDTLTELRVDVTAGSLDDANQALSDAGLGHCADPTHAWLEIERLRTQARTADPTWDERFDAMIGYAAKNGWIDDTGTTVRAHCTWS